MIDIKAREARHVALDFVVRFHRDDDSSPWEAVQAEQDAWIAQQDEPKPSRPEAIRQLLGEALGASPNSKP